MSWIIEPVGALCLTTVTGSIFTCVWVWIGKKLDEKGFVNILYYLMWMNAFFYLVPVVYGIWWFQKRLGQVTHKGLIFIPTPWIIQLAVVFAGLWLTGVIVCLLRYIGAEWYSWKKCSKGYAAEKEEEEILRQEGRKLRINTKRIRLMHSYHVSVPCLKGVVFPKVILPAAGFESRRLQMILTHELNHYRQKDLILKYLCALILCLHWFSPIAWWYRRLVYRWCEYVCDYHSMKQVESVREYVEELTRISLAEHPMLGVASMWFEEKKEVEERVKRIVRYSRMNRFSAKAAVILCLLMFLISSGSVYAASDLLGRGYVMVWNQTEVAVQEELVPLQLKKLEEKEEAPGEWQNGKVVWGDIHSQTRSSIVVSWNVEPGVLMNTSEFYLEAGDSIRMVAAISPGTSLTDIGLILPNGSLRYVSEYSALEHTFSINTDGNYRFFVRNRSSVDIEATVTVIFE